MMPDLHRPIYHLMPEVNWMNDPNGPLYYDGEYHLFYQYNPFGKQWGSIHWGHASSADMVHWRHWPVALCPSTSLGEQHCFSGAAVVHDGVPTIIYTSIGDGDWNPTSGAQQWLATSHDNMVTWNKHPENPILTNAIHGDLEVQEWRDPFVWRDDDDWYMVLGGTHNHSGCTLIYRSANLMQWEFLNILAQDPGEAWECPNFFRLGAKHVLVYSPFGPVRYRMGTLHADFRFSSEQVGWIDHGGIEGYYATNSMLDERGRRIMWGWLPESARGDLNPDCAWAGVQSLPRVLTMGLDDHLRIHPLPELTTLRYRHWHEEHIAISEQGRLLAAHGKALEIIVTIEVPTADASFALKVLSSLETVEETVIAYAAGTHELAIDRSRSSLSDLPHKSRLTAALPALGDTVTLHVFVDHSVVEVFADYRECITTRVYPVSADAVHVMLCSGSHQIVKVTSLDVWQLQSCWR